MLLLDALQSPCLGLKPPQLTECRDQTLSILEERTAVLAVGWEGAVGSQVSSVLSLEKGDSDSRFSLVVDSDDIRVVNLVIGQYVSFLSIRMMYILDMKLVGCILLN